MRPDGEVLELQVREAQRLVPRLVAAAEQSGHEVLDISVSEPTLENVFIALTGRALRE